MIFGEQVFDEIRSAWIADQEHPRRNRRNIPPPPTAELREIIEVSFKASLRTEEERKTAFAISIVPRVEEERETLLKGTQQAIFSLGEEMPLTEDSLTKLSSACDPTFSCFLADWEEGAKKRGKIWGVAYFDGTSSRLDEVPVSIEGFITHRPDVLTVTSLSPGALMLSRGDAQIGRFILGEFIPATPSPLAYKAMGEYIIRRLSKSELYSQYGNSYWLLFRDLLDYLISEVSKRGHGGIVIICPAASVEELKKSYYTRYKLDGNLLMRQLLERAVKGLSPKPSDIGSLSSGLLENIEIRRLIKTRLEFMAQLASVDGALLLTEEFQPSAFGANLNAPEWNGDVVVGPDGFGGGGEPFDLSRHGMRHNSAARFLAAHPTTFGFVISQDGPIRGMVRQDEAKLLIWKDCSVSMFI